MKKITALMSVFLAITISSGLCLGESEGDKKYFITLDKGLLSIDAREAPAKDLFKDLGEICGIKIVINENSFPEESVSVRFKDIPLEEAIKRQ